MGQHKFLFFIAIPLLILAISSFTINSYSQSIDSETSLLSEKRTFIFVQTFLENSDGKIITYLTSDKFTDIDSETLNYILDSEVNEKDPIITINDQKFQIIKRAKKILYEKDNVIASTILAINIDGKLETAARFAHDGYPILEGETVRSIWTFIRPVS